MIDMRDDHYPQGSSTKLLNTDRVTPQTRQVLQERLENPPVTDPKFFTPQAFETVKAVCNRLIPQDADRPQVDLPGILDTLLAANKGDGWRYDALPEDSMTHQQGIAGIEEIARLKYHQEFADLESDLQDELLTAVQGGRVEGNAWQHLNAKLYFEELLALVTEAYYSHPLAKDEIGEVSWADAGGWQQFGLDSREPVEPPAL